MSLVHTSSKTSYTLVTGNEAEQFLTALNNAAGVSIPNQYGPRRRNVAARKYPYLQWRSLTSDQNEVHTDIVGLRGYLLEVSYRFEQKPYQEDGQAKVLCYSKQCTVGGQTIQADYPFPYPLYGPSDYVRTSDGSPLPVSQVRQMDNRARNLQPVGSNPDRGRSCAECVANGNHVYYEEQNGKTQETICGGSGYIMFCATDFAVQRGARVKGQVVYTHEFIPIEEYEYLGDRPFQGPILLRIWINRQSALRKIAVDFKKANFPEDLLNLDKFLQSLRVNYQLVRPIKRPNRNYYQLQYQPAVELFMVPTTDDKKTVAVPLFRIANEMREFPHSPDATVDNWLDLAWQLLESDEDLHEEDDSFFSETDNSIV